MSNDTAGPRALAREPKPGEWLTNEEFSTVVRVTPLISIDLIVRTPDGKILVGRRTHEPAKGTYFVPGGRVTKNEKLAAAFRRISEQELGAAREMEAARFLGVYEHFYPTNRLLHAGFGTHYIVLGYELRDAIAAEALPTEQHTEYAWLTESELLSSPLVHENTKAYFR